MFKIEKLILYSPTDEEYVYEFKSGINYFRGKNSSGKTVFYDFVDFMLGKSEDIREKLWFKDSLKKATMIISLDRISYMLTRYANPKINYFKYLDEESEEAEIIDLREYKDRLNSIFAKDIALLRQIREFTEQELTYRTFSMFNFLGEKRQGTIHDFLDKCGNIEYSVKLAPLLNFIFNNNLEKIHELQKELEQLLAKMKSYEEKSSKFDFICNQVNKNLQKLGTNVWYTGSNDEDIRRSIDELKNMEQPQRKGVEKNIADLEVIYNNISEQIKVYENTISDAKQFEKENTNRKSLLENLEQLLKESEDFTYLVNPLEELIRSLDNTISFSQYTIKDKTITELKKQQSKLRIAIKRNDARFRCFTMEEKAKAIALIEEYLQADIHNCSSELQETKRQIKEVKDEIKILQNSDNLVKIRELSSYITNLYESAKGISSVVDDDLAQEGFRIKYLKRGNILQPMFQTVEKDENEVERKQEVNYYIGSMARHTLIQLCGYLGFLKLLLEEEKYPLVPILVIDHVSKPFDEKNAYAIGRIIAKACEDIGKENLQIIMFDDKEYDALSLKPDYQSNLVSKGKSGFNPFFFSESNDVMEEDGQKNEEIVD